MVAKIVKIFYIIWLILISIFYIKAIYLAKFL